MAKTHKIFDNNFKFCIFKKKSAKRENPNNFNPRILMKNNINIIFIQALWCLSRGSLLRNSPIKPNIEIFSSSALAVEALFTSIQNISLVQIATVLNPIKMTEDPQKQILLITDF